MQFSVAVITAIAAAVASASPLQPRWFPTCDYKNLGSIAEANKIVATLAAKKGSLTISGQDKVTLGQTTVNGITTTVFAYLGWIDTDTATYVDIAAAVKTAIDTCTPLGSKGFVSGDRPINDTSDFVVGVKGTYVPK